MQIGNNSHDEGTVPGATVAMNLCLLILENTQYITLSETGQYSTKMRCYFHCQCDHFIKYFYDPVLDAAVIYVGDIPF